MQVYVEHHSWRKKSKTRWSGNIVLKFKNLSSLEKYIIDMYDRYPNEDISYSIFECLEGPKGELLAKLHYKKQKFNLVCVSNKWRKFCYQY